MEKNIIYQILIFLYSTGLILAQEDICIYSNYEVFGEDTINRFENGLKTGIWVNYTFSGESISCFTNEKCSHRKTLRYILSEGEFVRGIPVGEWKYYYETGELKKITIFGTNGERDGIEVLYSHNGDSLRIGNWKNGIKVNDWHWYYKTGELRGIERYSNKITGEELSISFYKNGKIECRRIRIKENIEEQTCFYRDGTLKFKCEIIDDKIFKFEIFYPNGKLKYYGDKLNKWFIEDLQVYNKVGELIEIRNDNLGTLFFIEGFSGFLMD